MKLVTTAEMRRLEQLADRAGLAYGTMMENAGRATAQVVAGRLGSTSGRILVLVGPGNNGGDGLVSARYLAGWGHQVAVYIWKRARADDPNLAKVIEGDIPLFRAEEDQDWRELDKQVAECDILLDALLGTGVSGELRGTIPELLRRVHRGLVERQKQETAIPAVPRSIAAVPEQAASPHAPLVIAIDLPSGLNSDSGEIAPLSLQADVTVTFAYPKRGHFMFPGAAYVGELLVVDIGIDDALAADLTVEVATRDAIARLLPERPANAHKGTFGKAMIVAGSTNYVGAPCLAAEAAYRSGAGLVTLAVPEAIHPIVSSKLTEATYLVLPDSMGALLPTACRLLEKHLTSYDALLVGPGLGQAPETGAFVQALFGSGGGRQELGFTSLPSSPPKTHHLPPLVIDADGLNLLSRHTGWWHDLPEQTVLTPHPGEMARLLRCSIADIDADRLTVASQAAGEWGCTVVLKGAHSVVAHPDGRLTVIPFANPALATAGTGDVLAGIIVALMAQGARAYDAAIAGAYLHASAGELWRREYGDRGMLAGDLLPLLPRALRSLIRS